MSRLRLVMVARRFWPLAGGSERAIANLAAELVARGVEVTLLTPKWEDSWPDRIDYRRVTVLRLARAGRGFLGPHRWLRNLSRFLRQNAERFDAAYVCGLRDESRVTLKELQRRGAVVVLRAETSGPSGDCLWQLESRAGRSIKRQAMRADGFVGSTEIAHRELIAAGYPRDRIRRILGGVPVPAPLNAAGKLTARWALESVNTLLHCPPETPVAVYTGSLAERNGSAIAVDAWRHVVRRWPNARLWLIGPDANQSALNRQIDVAGLLGRVVIPGVFADVTELLGAADVAIIGPEEGNSPLLLLEAMAAGLPTVATDTSEHRYLADHGACARIFPSGDRAALGQLLVELFDDVDEASRLGETARDCATRDYGLGKVADEHLTMLEDLVQKRRSST